MASTYNAATGVCDDFVLEMHYKIYFMAAPEDQQLSDETKVAGQTWASLKEKGIMQPGYESTAWFVSIYFVFSILEFDLSH